MHEETCVFGNDFSLYVEMQSCGFRWPMCQKSFWIDHFAPFLPHLRIFGKILMPNEIHVVHLIVDPQLYSTKFNMNIVHITP